jgi:hypothetical protein
MKKQSDGCRLQIDQVQGRSLLSDRYMITNHDREAGLPSPSVE